MASSRHISPGRAKTTAHRGRESSFPPGPMRPVSTISGIWSQYRTPRITGRAQATRVTISSARCFSGDRCFPYSSAPRISRSRGRVSFFFRLLITGRVPPLESTDRGFCQKIQSLRSQPVDAGGGNGYYYIWKNRFCKALSRKRPVRPALFRPARRSSGKIGHIWNLFSFPSFLRFFQ